MTKLERLEKLATSQREVALSLWSEPCDRRASQNGATCEEIEEARALDDGTARGFAEYDAERMCPSCRAHWHAEMSARTLENATATGKRLNARLARTRAPMLSDESATPVKIASGR